MSRVVPVHVIIYVALALLLVGSIISALPARAEQGYYAPIGSCDTAGYASGIAVAGTHAYVADGTALRIIDVSDPTDPVEVGHFDGFADALDVAVSGSYAYVTDGTNGLWVLSVSNPASPVQVGHLATTSQAQAFLAKSIALKGSYALVGTYAQGTRFISIADPAHPAEAAFKFGPLWGADVAVDGGYAYVADLYGNTWIYDILDPAEPQELIQWTFGGAGVYGVAGVGDWVYVSDTNALYASYSPDHTHPSGGYYVPGACGRVKVVGGYVYVAWDVASHPNGGLEVIDQSDPAHRIFGYWNTTGQSRNLDVANGYVYLADGDAGLVIFPQAAPGSIGGQVRVRGTTTNIQGATVEASIGGVVKGSATTDANGMYSIPSLRPGAYDVTARKQGYAAQTNSGVVLGVGQTVNANFSLDALSLSGQVRQAGTTMNLPGATVAAYLGSATTPSATATADANGIYEIGGLDTGTYTVVASMTGYVRQTKPGIAVTAGVATYVNFGLAVSGKLKGQVLDKVSGTPIVGAAIIARTSGVVWATGVTAAPYGVYEIASDLPAGTYSLLATKTGYLDQGKIGVVVSAWATTYVNFQLASVCLKGQVRQVGTTTNLAGATVAAYDGATLKATATTDANGIYQIGGLATGTYTVIASKTGYVKQTKPGIAVTAGAITYVNFALAVSGKLKGQVTEKGSGLPIIGATISARSGGVVRATGTTVGPYGVYEIASDLPAGTYSVLCQKSGYQDFGRIGIVVTAGATTYVNFGLQPR